MAPGKITIVDVKQSRGGSVERSAVPLFKTNLKTAWAEGKRSAEAEIERVMPMQSAAHLAAPLMQAFGSDGPKRGKSLTQHDLVKWMLSQYEFSSRALKALAYQKIDAAIREALQVLEHAELVYISVDSDQPDKWTATGAGLAALARGKDVVRQHITERTGTASPPKPIDERLQELDNLRSTGVISEAEYNTKRGQIIDEI